MRPLPELTAANEWFWTSGADGSLRIQGCTDCGELVHPPVPICPYCRSRSSKPTPVSGRGTVVGFTVNAHRWLPDFDPPYVIANVALAEDARVHLTTNIVGCDPSEVAHRPGGLGPLRAARGRVAAAVRADGRRWTRSTACPSPCGRCPGRRCSAERFEHRAVLSGIGRSSDSAVASWSTPCRWPSTPASRRSPTPG